MPERAASAGRQGVLYSLLGSAMLSSIDPASNYSFQALTCSDLTSSARDSRVGRAGMRCDGRGCAQCTACKTRDAGSWRYERGARLLACLRGCASAAAVDLCSAGATRSEHLAQDPRPRLSHTPHPTPEPDRTGPGIDSGISRAVAQRQRGAALASSRCSSLSAQRTREQSPAEALNARPDSHPPASSSMPPVDPLST